MMEEYLNVGCGPFRTKSNFKGWPVVSFSEDQMALIARRPQ